jgi:Ca2+-binding EF-hand superfamily protein
MEIFIIKDRIYHKYGEKMKILNCESLEETYESLEQIASLDKDSIEAIFREVPKEVYIDEKYFVSTLKNLKCRTEYDGTYFFHVTKTLDIDSIKNKGLITLDKGFEILSNSLFELTDDFTKQEWDTVIRLVKKEKKVRFDFDYDINAFLVKESFLNLDSWSYMEFPEIADDIFKEAEKMKNSNIRKVFSLQAVPCIVTFLVNTNEIKYLGHALNYLYDKYVDEEVGEYSTYNTKENIKCEQVVSIDILK